MAREYTCGLMAESTKVTGNVIKCTAMAPSHGQMVESTWESMLMTERMVTVSSFGQMVDLTKVIGKMGNNMEKVCMSHHKASRNMENGKRARDIDGSAGMEVNVKFDIYIVRELFFLTKSCTVFVKKPKLII